MQYTCGRFERGDEDIDQAQIAKFELIERLAAERLGGLSGKEHLDIGCGWGGMVGYFRDKIGMQSVGNTNCAPQALYARRRYKADVILCDFSRLADLGKKFDLITIVGMIEQSDTA